MNIANFQMPTTSRLVTSDFDLAEQRPGVGPSAAVRCHFGGGGGGERNLYQELLGEVGARAQTAPWISGRCAISCLARLAERSAIPKKFRRARIS
jgi:hypothetical protein